MVDDAVPDTALPPSRETPVVLVCAGNDPSGGAGLAADSAALLSQGCYPCPVVTAITVQDTRGLSRLVPVSAELVEAQARAVLADLPVAMCKLGVVGSADNAAAIGRALADYPQIPLVLDPVLRAGGGGELATAGIEQALLDHLLPRTLVMTPNIDEARRLLPGVDGPEALAQGLRVRGCDYVLLTTADESVDALGDESAMAGEVVNTLYGPDGLVEHQRWPRLPGGYHGSGCTMASALAGLLARGVDIRRAAREAQAFTWQALRASLSVGHGQRLPDRLFWAQYQGVIRGGNQETIW
jgi:hydroxymethylpyrimidine/phosphomethylpyrimidine kinase